MEAEWPSAEFHCSADRSGGLSSAGLPVLPLRQSFSVAITPQVSVIKVKIHEATGMPAGKQKLQYEVNSSSAPFPNPSFSLAVLLTTVFIYSLSGHFHQGFQLSGLLQHEQWRRHSPGSEGERRKKEMIHATTNGVLPRNLVAHSCCFG